MKLLVTRLLSAPRDLVFKAFTEPEHLVKCWGPKGFTNTNKEISVKPGGVWNFIMHGPDGTDYPNRIVFEEVSKNRISYTHGGEEGEPGTFHSVITLEEKGQKTFLSMRAIFATAAEREMVVREHGAIEGGKQTIDKLQAHLLTMI